MHEEQTIRPAVKVLEWVETQDARTGYLRLLDQTLLPERTHYLDCREPAVLWDAIRRLVVRGAPAIGVAGAYGMVLVGQAVAASRHFADDLAAGAKYLESSRPTAVNLAWAVRRVLGRAQHEIAAKADPAATIAAMLDEAKTIHAEDERMCLEIGRYASELIMRCQGVLTHCNAGALATAGIGTATAGMYVAHGRGHRFTVYCDETRPLLQGARLTAWELMQSGIDAVLITDSMAATVLREGRVQMVIVGADRIAANGDTANKIGTYGLAIAAARHHVPFYVAAPYSTFDLAIPDGGRIPIEERSAEEITEGFGRRTAPHGVRTYSPAFDVTPADLITGIVTERGIIQPVNAATVASMLKSS